MIAFGSKRWRTMSRTSLMASAERGHHQHEIGIDRADLGDFDREVLRLGIVGDRLGQLERHLRGGEHAVHRLALAGAERVVGVHEHGRLEIDLGRRR